MPEEKINQMNKDLENVQKKLLIDLNGFDGSESASTLYHYTNLQAAQSILLNEELWLTDVKYLNDPRELKEGLEIYNKISNECLEEYKTKNIKFYLGMSLIKLNVNLSLCEDNEDDEIKNTHNSFIKKNSVLNIDHFNKKKSIYISSLSDQSDALRQWIPYASDGSGLALGFKGVNKYHEISVEDDISMIATSYQSRGKKEKYVRDLYEELYKIFISFDGEEAIFGYFATAVLEIILGSIIACKSESYHDEREWRLVCFGDRYDFKDRVKFRVRNNYIVPYISIKINRASVKNIVLGPKVNHSLTQMSLVQIKNKIGYDFEMTNSKVSYR